VRSEGYNADEQLQEILAGAPAFRKGFFFHQYLKINERTLVFILNLPDNLSKGGFTMLPQRPEKKTRVVEWAACPPWKNPSANTCALT
jgi:hypothetical protein